MKKLWATWKTLREQGILGINQRNVDFIQRYNPRKYYPLVDNKLKTKQLAQEAGIDVPALLCVVEIEHHVSVLLQTLSPYDSFVIKPAQGSGGDGVLVIKGRVNDLFIKATGQSITGAQLCFHVSNILTGIYSLGGHPDVAMIEERVIHDPIFDKLAYQGVPDIRVIVCLGYPAMAMLRLPTRCSSGKSNLHQGAIGVGIDLKTGRTLDTDLHPDTGALLSDILIPQWPKLLELCARCYELTGMGYLGVDLVLDQRHGPLVLELNARPGLGIQLANRQGLVPRLNLIKTQVAQNRSPEQRVSFILEQAEF